MVLLLLLCYLGVSIIPAILFFLFTYTWVGWGAPDSPVAAPTYAAPVRYACIHRTNCISNIVDNPMQILSRAAATETKCVTYHTRIP